MYMCVYAYVHVYDMAPLVRAQDGQLAYGDAAGQLDDFLAALEDRHAAYINVIVIVIIYTDHTCIYIYIYTLCTYVCMYIYIYTYRERETY